MKYPKVTIEVIKFSDLPTRISKEIINALTLMGDMASLIELIGVYFRQGEAPWYYEVKIVYAPIPPLIDKKEETFPITIEGGFADGWLSDKIIKATNQVTQRRRSEVAELASLLDSFAPIPIKRPGG